MSSYLKEKMHSPAPYPRPWPLTPERNPILTPNNHTFHLSGLGFDQLNFIVAQWGCTANLKYPDVPQLIIFRSAGSVITYAQKTGNKKESRQVIHVWFAPRLNLWSALYWRALSSAALHHSFRLHLVPHRRDTDWNVERGKSKEISPLLLPRHWPQKHE